ncbi:MAG TPA: ABC transporter ATP-binding protein [Rugosimonospora sp.]|nr:ABC transporter ATP-binding protein [Rugosimonospora sp.]
MATVALKDVTKIFNDGTIAVDNVSLDVGDGEFMVLLGPSGCGKSTVLRMVAGLEDPTSGAILLGGEVANDLPPRDRKIAMVFQDFALYPHMTVGDNIGFPLRLSGVDPHPRAERVADVASALGIGDVLGRKPSQLSGGQRQRVAMGRAIVRRPGLFLMDEPLSNLDSGLRAELRAEISGLTRELGVTTVYVTHDQAEALTMADRVAIMRRGVLQDVGTPTQVYNRPGTLYVAAFLGSPRMNLLEAQVYVHLDRHVALHMGDQTLYLPWNDLRARAVAHYHGERIVVGMRAEALTPVPVDTQGDVLRGRIRYLEHHGHESLAFLDIGAYAVVVDDIGGTPPEIKDGARGLRRLGSLVRRAAGARPNGNGNGGRGELVAAGVGSRSANGHSALAPTGRPDPVGRNAPGIFSDPGRHHRRPAELAVRLAPYPAVSAGHPLAVQVRMDALHFFDDRGQRIDVGWR